MNMKGIPTLYKGQMFRSRLEARWASFFDAVGWDWEYEPFDLAGYIPDFVLKFYEPVLVEIKPEVNFEGLHQHAEKILNSGWEKEFVIFGASLMNESRPYVGKHSSAMLGGIHDIDLPRESVSFASRWHGHLNPCLFQKCKKCNLYSFFDLIGTHTCRVSGCYDGTRYLNSINYSNALEIWRKASNEVQWKKPAPEKPYERGSNHWERKSRLWEAESTYGIYIDIGDPIYNPVSCAGQLGESVEVEIGGLPSIYEIGEPHEIGELHQIVEVLPCAIDISNQSGQMPGDAAAFDSRIELEGYEKEIEKVLREYYGEDYEEMIKDPRHGGKRI